MPEESSNQGADTRDNTVDRLKISDFILMSYINQDKGLYYMYVMID